MIHFPTCKTKVAAAAEKWREVVAALKPREAGWAWIHSPKPSSSRSRWIAFAMVLALHVTLLFVTWGSWSDLVIDFGRELYVPWQLSEGAVLYRDVAYFNGPLSPAINAVIFKGFGASFATLVITNAVILALITGILFRQLVRQFSLGISLISVVSFLLIFGYGHTYGIGNFNFLCPYSHEMTHGLLECLILLECLTLPVGRRWVSLLAGAVWGLTFLGKPEVFFAASALILGEAGFSYGFRIRSLRSTVYRLATLVLGLAAVYAGAVAVLGWHQGDGATCGIDALGAWPWLLTSDVSNLYFYRTISGLDTPWLNLAMALANLLGGGLLIWGSNVSRYAARGARGWHALAVIAGIGLLLVGPRWVLKNFFVYGILLVGLSLWGANRFRATQYVRYQHLFCWSVLGLAFLQKMFLYPRIDGYGFVLAAPIVVLGIAVALEWLPTMFFVGESKRWVTLGLVVLMLVDCGTIIGISQERMRSKNYRLGTLSEGIRTYPCIGPAAEGAIRFVRENVPPGQSVLVLPEGVMLNYLVRRPSPAPYYNFMPPELEMFGEPQILRELSDRPPQLVLLVRRVVYEYGLQRFGDDGYGTQIMKWVEQNYTPTLTIGDDPLFGEDFGITVFARRDQPVTRTLVRAAAEPTGPIDAKSPLDPRLDGQRTISKYPH